MNALKAKVSEIHYGCSNCGGGEMRRKPKEILASMHTRIYNGFGGWMITAGEKCVYSPPCDLEYEDYPTLMKFENMARKEPTKDWRAILTLPLREAEYQRQGRNRWVLIKTGRGFA